MRVRALFPLLVLLAVGCKSKRVSEARPVSLSHVPVPVPVPVPDLSLSPSPPLPPSPLSRVVLVTLDGVRWEDSFDLPAMPNLQRLVRDRGTAIGGSACPTDMRASGPSFVSLPGYLEIFTGQPSACTHNNCAPVDTPTIVDEARASTTRDADVAVFASWNLLANAAVHDRKSIVLSAGARTIPPMARSDAKLASLFVSGARSAGYPGAGDYRPDMYTSRIALRYLETQSPRFLVVGLGDADEHAHRGDIAGYRRAIVRADEFVGDLEHALSRMGDDGAHTTVIVTTDHGRAKTLRAHGALYPESAKVWVAAFGAGIAHRGLACASVPLHLADLAGVVRARLGLASDNLSGPLAAELADATSESAPRSVR